MEGITTCKVCYLNYEIKNRAPRSLPCGHTLCSNCLVNILNNLNLRKCPFDNHVLKYSQSFLESFPINYIVLEMLEQKKSNLCKTHPGESLKLICLNDKTRICPECAKHEDHKDHEIKKIKTLKAQGAKVKEELQEILLDVKQYEREKEKDCEQIKKVFIRSITEQFKEIKEILVEKEFELVQQANTLFDADKNNDSEGISTFKQQIDENIKGITDICQDEDGDMTILDKKVKSNDQNTVKRRTQFLREKSSRVQHKVLGMQRSLKETFVNSKSVLNSLQLSTQDVVKEIYSAQEENEQLSQEELTRRYKKLRTLKFVSYFDFRQTSGCLEIFANHHQLHEVEINLDDLQETQRISIQLDRYDTLRKDPIPNVLSYIFHGLKNLVEVNVSFRITPLSNESLLWLGEIIQNHTQHLKGLFLNLQGCKFNKDSVPILCKTILSPTTNLHSFGLNLDYCEVTDADLKLLIESLKPFHKNLSFFGLGLSGNTQITSHGIDKLFKLIQSMSGLQELRLLLGGLKVWSETFKMLGDSVLPNLPSLAFLYLWLNETAISDGAISSILKNLPNLKGLNIDLSAALLTDKTLEMFIDEVLPRLKGLKSFSFKFEESRIKKKNISKIQKVFESFEQKQSHQAEN